MRAQLLGEGLALVVEDVGDDDLGPFRPEQPGLLLPLAACGACDEDDTSVELAHVDSLRGALTEVSVPP